MELPFMLMYFALFNLYFFSVAKQEYVNLINIFNIYKMYRIIMCTYILALEG